MLGNKVIIEIFDFLNYLFRELMLVIFNLLAFLAKDITFNFTFHDTSRVDDGSDFENWRKKARKR